MCSINGFTWKDEALIKKMNAVTAHRGPDGTGVFCDPGVSIGHNRLAIIDLSPLGAQPMKSHNGRFVISFNGEIYNYRELKRELESFYPFRSATDTEVILAAYSVWGERAFARLNGMFAIALWDTKEQKLLLVRDPIGIKPLYYYHDGARIVFSSEIKAILEHTNIPRRIDALALDLYLRVNYVPAPLTLFSGIKKLLPGHALTCVNGKMEVRRYAPEEKPAISHKSQRRLASELRERVRASVKAELVSDRPVGLYLSGGIDSSAVLEGMAVAQGKVETFSIGFSLREGEQEEKFNADFLLARRTAKHFGATHHEVLLSPDEILPLFEEAVYYLDEPIANATVIPMLKLSRFAKSRVAVALCGDGGDELFGGYERYRLSLLSSYYRCLPATFRRAASSLYPRFRKLDTAQGIPRFAQFHFLKEGALRPLLSPFAYHAHAARDFFVERFFSSVPRDILKKVGLRGGGRVTSIGRAATAPFFESFERLFMNVDRQSWLTDESLLRSDKMGMAAGLEARVPLLDLPLVDFAGTIPFKHKVSLFRTKIILKEAFRGFLPDELLRQPKRGWFSPGAKWLRYPRVAAFAREVLSPDYCAATKNLFQWDAVRSRLEGHLSGEYHLTLLWAILTLQLWARRFKISI